MLTSAHARREEYVRPWLPEPVVDGLRPSDCVMRARLTVGLESASPDQGGCSRLPPSSVEGCDEIGSADHRFITKRCFRR
jgi:hypothetical protein